MLTDRCSTAGLLMILSVEYLPIDASLSFPLCRTAFLLLVLLDVSSHWMQTYSVLATGHHHKSKEGNKGRNILVVRLLSCFSALSFARPTFNFNSSSHNPCYSNGSMPIIGSSGIFVSELNLRI